MAQSINLDILVLPSDELPNNFRTAFAMVSGKRKRILWGE